MKPPRFGTWTSRLARKSNGKSLGPANRRGTARFADAENPADAMEDEPGEFTPVSLSSACLGPAPEPKIAIIGPRDYGLPEGESRAQSASQRSRRQEFQRQLPALLDYDPLRPFSLSDCCRGKAIRYGEYTGTILALLDDPYTPMIKVAFPEHPNLVMREVLLAVGKRQVRKDLVAAV